MSLPSNIKLLQSEAFTTSLNQLRDRSLKPAAVRRLVRELSATISSAAISKPSPGEKTALVVILRSGMAMSDAFLEQFGDDEDIVVYHLGLFREQATLEPVEYYNKLPIKDPRIRRAYIVDPLIATGGTAVAAIEILKYVYSLILSCFVAH
jgi:uracil phosphoribosyltransferase